MTEPKIFIFLVCKNLNSIFSIWLAHFILEVSLHSWLLWPRVRHGYNYGYAYHLNISLGKNDEEADRVTCQHLRFVCLPTKNVGQTGRTRRGRKKKVLYIGAKMIPKSHLNNFFKPPWRPPVHSMLYIDSKKIHQLRRSTFLYIYDIRMSIWFYNFLLVLIFIDKSKGLLTHETQGQRHR